MLQTTIKERAFESQYAYEHGVDFKVKARACRLLGLWAGEKMQYSFTEKEFYTDNFIQCGLHLSFDSLIEKLTADFRQAGLEDITKLEVIAIVDSAQSISRDQVMNSIH